MVCVLSTSEGNGTVQLESELEILNSAGVKQLNIFSPQNEEKTWRSIQSVLQKKTTAQFFDSIKKQASSELYMPYQC